MAHLAADLYLLMKFTNDTIPHMWYNALKIHICGGEKSMKCTQCNAEMRIAPEIAGTDSSGTPIYHRIAYCDNCKIKIDLDMAQNNQDGKKKESACGIIGMICSFIFCFILFPIIGFILSLIGVCSKKKKSTCGTIGLVVSILAIALNMLAPEYMGYVEKAKETDAPRQESQSTENSTREESRSESKTNSAKETMFRKGEIAEMNGVQVTLTDYKESNGSEYNTPSDGNVFILVEFEIANNTKKELAVSSMLSFDAYADDYALSYSLSALMEKDGTQLDGTIAAGKKLKGWIGWEVPEDYGVIEIHFKDNVWSDNKFIFLIEK